jgi:hypothetical protein
LVEVLSSHHQSLQELAYSFHLVTYTIIYKKASASSIIFVGIHNPKDLFVIVGNIPFTNVAKVNIIYMSLEDSIS